MSLSLSRDYRISVPSEPAFMKSMRQSPYTDPKWLAGMKHAVVVDKNKNDICAKEQEAHLQVLRSEQESQDRVCSLKGRALTMHGVVCKLRKLHVI